MDKDRMWRKVHAHTHNKTQTTQANKQTNKHNKNKNNEKTHYHTYLCVTGKESSVKEGNLVAWMFIGNSP